MEVKVDKIGKITLPKQLRDKYNLLPDTEIKIIDWNGEFTLNISTVKIRVNM